MQQVIPVDDIQRYTDQIDQTVIDYIKESQIETFEGFPDYDLVAFDWYDIGGHDAPPAQIIIYIDRQDMLFICENAAALAAARTMFTPDATNEHAMYLFFKNLFKGSTRQIEQLENRLAALDDDVTDGVEDGLRDKLIDIRCQVMRLRKYYEQMVLVFSEICDNDNGLISDDCLKYFEILRSRSMRLVSQAGILREYVTQIRESYQAEIGIEQNELMKVFTIVTSIFLPLTLIVGWYGMNLRMPEFGWRYGYLFVIIICLAVVAIWYVVFKRKKWF